jgi:hypothetical protein
MKYGKLIFSREENRLDILSEDGSLLGGLHCGDRLDVLVDHKWTPTRVEYDHDWYLFGLYPSGQIPVGLEVRGCT